MTPRPARILHTSDCHLDEVDGGRHQRAFSAAIDRSIALDVDLVLIAGDLFDHARVGDAILEWAASELDRAARPIVLIAGNHDTMHAASVHHRFDAEQRCRNVQFIDDPAGATLTVPGTDIVVWGRAMVEHDPRYRPLDGWVARRPGTWHVIAAHGLVVQGGANGRSSPIPHTDLVALDADYVALGHVHVHQVVSQQPLAVYPGATALSHGGSAGCVVVDLETGHPATVTWLPLDC